MKNYSLNFNDSKTFILNYKVEDNQIIANLASGEDYVIPYTLENEKNLLERMKKQVLNSNEFLSQQEKRFSFSWKWALVCGVVLAFNSIFLVTGNSVAPVVTGMVCSYFAFDITFRIYSMVDSKRKIKDICKNKMFLNNEELLNQKVKSHQNILSNTDKKTKELVSSTPENKPVFSLNNMDEIKYDELKKIIENIKRDEQFAFDYSSTQEKKPMVLTKKKNN